MEDDPRIRGSTAKRPRGANGGDSGGVRLAVVVGIGASAGGLRALRAFFEALPPHTGLTFVVVIHLSPDYESNLAELIQASTAIPVQQVTQKTPLLPDHIYVIPPNKNLEFADGHVTVTALTESRTGRATIDTFFRTLAEKHPYSIGILFSGGGTDGTAGMLAIKEHGGLLMAQLPEEAEHDQMPRSAIRTGLVDFVLPARALAEKLVEIRWHGGPLMLDEASDTLSENDEDALREILAEVRARSENDFIGYKRPTILRRIARRMRIASAGDLKAYLGYLHRNAGEADALAKDFLISVTNFFRDEQAFKALSDRVISRIFQRKTRNDDIRVWVPGCASGEEAYSIATLLLEEADRVGECPRIQIFATDVNEEALAFAREGLYAEAVSADVSAQRLERYFSKEGSGYRVGKHLRQIILFGVHSLLRDPPFSGLDLISCRNVLIYLQRNLQQNVLDLFHYGLRPDGYLFMGGAETIEGTDHLFRALERNHGLYEREELPRGHRTRLPYLQNPGAAPKRSGRPGPFSEISKHQAYADFELHRHSLEGHAPPSLIANRDHSIVHLSDNAGRYLRITGGSPTTSILRLVRKELKIELSTALYSALEKDEATITSPVSVEIDGEIKLVQLHVQPVREEGSGPLALVVFAEGKQANTGPGRAQADSPASEARLRQTQEELEATREMLQITIGQNEAAQEDLSAASEELRSINEEYRTTLEELETSNEELQSVNEELATVNQELCEKVDALSLANDDMKNLMSATDVGMLFVDRNLLIKRFTPSLTNLFNIRPTDVERPFSHVTHRLKGGGIDDDVERVLRSLAPVEREVQDLDGRYYIMRVVPYRTIDDRVSGAVLTFVDFSSLRSARDQLRGTEDRYQLLVEGVTEYAIVMIDEGGRIASWNTGAARLFGYQAEEALGQPHDILFTDEDRASATPRAHLKLALREGQVVDDRWCVRKHGELFWGTGTLTAIRHEDGTLRGFARVLRDNTHRREAAETLRANQQHLETINKILTARTSELELVNSQVRKLATTLTQAEQKERRRISDILHDDLQQLIYGIEMKMALVRKSVKAGEFEPLLERVLDIEICLQDAVKTTRRLTVDLSPPALEGDGLTDALGWLRAQMKDLHELEVDLKAEHGFHIGDATLRILLFQAVRELLFNVIKHAEVGHATVELEDTDEVLVIRVSDDGAGFNVEEARLRHEAIGGFGLFSIRERLGLFGGQVEVVSAPGRGTRVVIQAPRSITENLNVNRVP
jgi:two-component system CheB/CheR fusion protein